MRGGPASHIDQGRRSRFPARVLLRPGYIISFNLWRFKFNFDTKSITWRPTWGESFMRQTNSFDYSRHRQHL